MNTEDQDQPVVENKDVESKKDAKEYSSDSPASLMHQLFFLQMYGYVSFSAFVRFILWVIVCYIVVQKFGWATNLFSTQAGLHGGTFLSESFTLYSIRIVINYLWHTLFHEMVTGYQGRESTGMSRIALKSSLTNQYRACLRASNWAEAFEIRARIKGLK